jgi:DTW domain-containing protein
MSARIAVLPAQSYRSTMDTAPAPAQDIAPVENRTAVLILQHPQEQDKSLGTAPILTRNLRNAQLRVGLSWPNLGMALGRPADPHRWAVLYLGSARPAELLPGEAVVALDHHGAPLADQTAALTGIEGVVLLDGSWSQAKALWWRNPWLLKLRRLALAPMTPSRYGALRREPRGESLSTLEAASLLLGRLEGNPEIAARLEAALTGMLTLFRTTARRPRRQQHRRYRGKGGHR